MSSKQYGIDQAASAKFVTAGQSPIFITAFSGATTDPESLKTVLVFASYATKPVTQVVVSGNWPLRQPKN
ncbi:MAG: hypothetical protein K6T83_06800 [Alicyclobacillus sp.]|nr:hypothetical protein [Alicyclobacillus sp.]